MARTWNDNLIAKLIQKFGEKEGKALFARFGTYFPTSYEEDNNTLTAIADIQKLQLLSDSHPLELELYQDSNDTDHPLHLRLFQFNKVTPLSEILPLLENMGLRTFNERPYVIDTGKIKFWVSDFSVTYVLGTMPDLKTVKSIFNDAFIQTQLGKNENDGFNKLILGAQASWREVMIIRAYAKYLHQIGFRFNQGYIEQATIANTAITKDLISLFITMHDPEQKARDKNIEKLDQDIQLLLDNITSLDEDRILRRFWQVMKATIRTNYFQLLNKEPKEYFSFKLNCEAIPELPLPHPLYEIFVYSPRFEGIHLRSAKVARGGIRWSDRREDFRTEVLGLMKAQKVKNAVIVPSGAKGGFVLKAMPELATRDIIRAEVDFCYKSFIRGLLDLTDNIKNNKVIRPKDVVCYDEEDTYLVVAADKGTATFSDTANSVSKEYDFWLGDAFASGGSVGYDHKKMGITARGAWESVKRHFRELNLNIEDTTFTAVGIGDMSGDVFGNGMLYSKNLKLIAAFDHRDIFLDPNPNPEKTFAERNRLFNLPTSSWQDFDTKLISKGGGIHKRSSKSIALTPEIKKALDIQESSLTPNELIRAILRAPVDLLFNGGIGTYVKASTESHADAGDKTNEFTRIDGQELRCKIVGEGGNLGFTQLGRVEYALTGGLINTDFIDNSAGVDCSDHEVNIKILLNKEVAKGKITEAERNKFLAKMTNEVAALVLHDNYSQALVMSFSASHATQYLNLYESYIQELEANKILKRSVEFLPDDKKLHERQSTGKGLTRPELAVLLAYSKIHIQAEILESNIPEDPFFNNVVQSAFPSLMAEKYSKELSEHSLRREIIATQLSNHVVNVMGITFAYRLQTETGSSIAEIVRAFSVASYVYQALEFDKLIESLNFRVPVAMQYSMLHHVRRLLNLATRWFLRANRLTGDLSQLVLHYTNGMKKLEVLIPELMTGVTKEYLNSLTKQFVDAGLPLEPAKRIAVSRALYTGLNIIEVATQHKFDLLQTAKMYFEVGGKFNLVWFRDQIANDSREGHWNTLARLSLRDQLDMLQRQLSIAIMRSRKKESSVAKLIDQWRDAHKVAIERWEKIQHMLYSSNTVDYVMFFISLGELADLIQGSC